MHPHAEFEVRNALYVRTVIPSTSAPRVVHVRKVPGVLTSIPHSDIPYDVSIHEPIQGRESLAASQRRRLDYPRQQLIEINVRLYPNLPRKTKARAWMGGIGPTRYCERCLPTCLPMHPSRSIC